MAFRNDITIDWTTSPRLITVAAPSIELTMQDLLDTLRALEDDLNNLHYPKIVSASGKELLSSDGTRVGITVSLQNATVGFEDRAGPTWTLCSLIGGNLVAYDVDGVTPIEPTHATAYVSIKATSSSSATLQEQEALQYGSYQNAVWLDITTSNSGVDFPSGTREYPVNNTQDAVLIAADKGFDTIRLIGNLTLGLGDDVSNLIIQGTNPLTSTLTVLPDAQTFGVYVKELYFTGTLDGGTILRDCVVGAVDYFSGYLENCAITSNTIKFNGSSSLLNCRAGAGSDIYPQFDLTNATDVSIWGYEGQAEFVNCTSPIHIDITMTGSLKISNTVTNGDFHIHGDCSVEHTQTGTEVIDDSSTGTPAEIANEVATRTLNSNIVSVQDVAVTTADDFKTDTTDLATKSDVINAALI